jgi:hypothetical protein
MRLLRTDEDFQGFRLVIVEAHRRHPLRILAYCILSNRWHFVLLPRADGQVTDYFRWLAHTHGMRWRRKQLAAYPFRPPVPVSPPESYHTGAMYRFFWTSEPEYATDSRGTIINYAEYYAQLWSKHLQETEAYKQMRELKKSYRPLIDREIAEQEAYWERWRQEYIEMYARFYN